MTASTLQIAVGYLALVCVLAMLAAIGVRCSPAVRTGIVVAEILLVVQAALDLTGQLRGHRPDERATHVGYLVVSVLLLPLLVGRTAYLDGHGNAIPRSDNLVVLVACMGAIVVVVRLHATWAT